MFKTFKVTAILEDKSEIEFHIGGVDEKGVGMTLSKMDNLWKIKNVELDLNPPTDISDITIQKF
tara:strand:- start:387 stop:578 length:192 start_codon:yes stop_codon:yes gene_type:complete